MQFMWELTIDDTIEIYERAMAAGIKHDESIETILLAYVKEKGIKPLVANDKTNDEILKDLTGQGKTILDIKHDEDGESDIRFIKKKEEDV